MATLVARLRATTALTSVLPEGQAGIREESWKGTAFQYPNVRVVRPALKPWGNGNCSGRQSAARLLILAFSKKDSSINVQLLQGLIRNALEGLRLQAAGLYMLPLRADQRGPATPDNAFDLGDHWRGEVRFRTVVFQPVPGPSIILAPAPVGAGLGPPP